MKPGTNDRPRSRQSLLTLPWIALFGLGLTALLTTYAEREYIRWSDVAWYQLIAGFALTIFGGMVSGWGIATFIASSKGIVSRGASYQIQPKAPQNKPGMESTSGKEDSQASPAAPEEDAESSETLDLVNNVGKKRARAAASVGFRTLDDVRRASLSRLEELRAALSSPAAFKSVLIQAKNDASDGDPS